MPSPLRGLGIGTAPAALIAHGVRTTTVEIDPVVHDFATKYFELPQNHTSVIGDAIEVVRDMQKAKERRNTYDFIIHDVFTGGAEPIDLFTREFIMGLSDLLTPNGIIAIVRSKFSRHEQVIYPEFATNIRSELCWRPASPYRRLSRPHRTIRLSKMPPISRIRATENPKGDGLYQHGHVLPENAGRLCVPRTSRSRLFGQPGAATASQAAT